MYGLQKILSEQGLSIEQQYALLELMQAAEVLNLDRLPFDLSDAGFEQREIEAITLSTLTARCSNGSTLNPEFLLTSLTEGNEHQIEKTNRWLNCIIKALLAEWEQKLSPHITERLLSSFTPQPAQPCLKEYDAIIIIDSEKQPIINGLNYVRNLLKTDTINTSKIIIPTQTNGLNRVVQLNATTLSNYIHQQLQLSSAKTQVIVDESLSQTTLKQFLIDLIEKEAAKTALLQQAQLNQSGIGFYAASYRPRQTQQILIVTTEDYYEHNKQVTSELAGHVISTEVVTSLHSRQFTENDLYNLLAERFSYQATPGEPLESLSNSAAAAAASADETIYTTTQDGATHTKRASRSEIPAAAPAPALPAASVPNNNLNSQYIIAVGLFGVGLFAAANPRAAAAATKSIAETAKTFAVATLNSLFL